MEDYDIISDGPRRTTKGHIVGMSVGVGPFRFHSRGRRGPGLLQQAADRAKADQRIADRLNRQGGQLNRQGGDLWTIADVRQERRAQELETQGLRKRAAAQAKDRRAATRQQMSEARRAKRAAMRLQSEAKRVAVRQRGEVKKAAMRQRRADWTQTRAETAAARQQTAAPTQTEKAATRQRSADTGVTRLTTPRLLPVWALLLITVPVGSFFLLGFVGAMAAGDVIPGVIMLLVVGALLALLWRPRHTAHTTAADS